MKTITFLCSLACMFTLAIGSSNAEPIASTTTTTSSPTTEMPEYLPIESKAILKAYILGAGRFGYVGLWGQKLLAYNGEVRTFRVDGKNANEIVKNLSAAGNTFHVRTSDSTKPIYAYGYILDEAGNTLFQSDYNQISTESDGNGGLKIANTSLSFKFGWRGVPIPVANVTSAEIQYEGADGNWWTKQLDVQNGYIFFPPEYAKKSGTLVVSSYSSNGYFQTAYSLSTGSRIPGTAIAGTPTSSIENHISASDKGMTASGVLVASGRMIPPSTNDWDLYSPPTATFTVTKGAGTLRTCTATFIIRARTQNDMTGIQAFALDSGHIATDGTAEEIPSSSITVTNVGLDWNVTVTWQLHNNAGELDGTDWQCYLVIPGYEKQRPPQYPYYGGVSKG